MDLKIQDTSKFTHFSAEISMRERERCPYLPHLASKSVMVMVSLSDMKHGGVVLLTGMQLLSMKNPGSFGSGKVAPSLPNIETTDGIVGLSSENF